MSGEPAGQTDLRVAQSRGVNSSALQRTGTAGKPCKAVGVERFAYLSDVLERLPAWTPIPN